MHLSSGLILTITSAVQTSKVRSNDLEFPKATASLPASAYSMSMSHVPTLQLLESMLMSALFHTAQASVCAMIFEFGHEVGRYSALLLELQTVACGLLRMGTADARTAARRASAGVPSRSPPGRLRTTGRHLVLCVWYVRARRPRVRGVGTIRCLQSH